MRALAIAALLLASSSARAQNLEAECASSYLADVGHQLLAMCYGDERQKCKDARAAFDAARAKGKL